MNVTVAQEPFATQGSFEEAVRQPSTIIPKDMLICQLCEGKSVLDVGCVDESVESALSQGEKWLHARITRVAREAVGLDYLEEAVLKLRAHGYSMVAADAESFALDRTFEVIVAADIVEHLSNVGKFFEAVKRHMDKNSMLIITTPNPFNIEQSIHAAVRGKVNLNPTHTQWFDPRTLKTICDRQGFDALSFYWIDTRFHYPLRPPGKLRNRIMNSFAQYVMRKRPVCRRDFALICRIHRAP